MNDFFSQCCCYPQQFIPVNTSEYSPTSGSARPDWAALVAETQKPEDKRELPSSPDSMIGKVGPDHYIRLIFLDVDGTINHIGESTTTICPWCVKQLKQILDETRARIVLSTTWRLTSHHRKTLFRYLRRLGIRKGLIIGQTRDLRGERRNRADEIRDWLKRPNMYYGASLQWNVLNWVSLDDLDLAKMEKDITMRRHHFRLNPALGLCKSQNIVRRVVDRLRRNDDGRSVENWRLNVGKRKSLTPPPQKPPTREWSKTPYRFSSEFPNQVLRVANPPVYRKGYTQIATSPIRSRRSFSDSHRYAVSRNHSNLPFAWKPELVPATSQHSYRCDPRVTYISRPAVLSREPTYLRSNELSHNVSPPRNGLATGELIIWNGRGIDIDQAPHRTYITGRGQVI